MNPQLRARLNACKNLPSPPAVAAQIVELASDPDVDMRNVIRAISMDPAITTRILRLANSPMYAQRTKTETLRKAVMVLGLNATISLALSFSLLKSWQNEGRGDGLDYPWFWRRALLAATIGRLLAPIAGVRDAEEVFLTCLIQDVGMLALARAVPSLYREIGDEQRRQAALVRHERERLGADHAAVGGWLLEQWSFPEQIEQCVTYSHEPERVAPGSRNGSRVRCVALSSVFAEVLLSGADGQALERLARSARMWLKLDRRQLSDLLEVASSQIPSIEAAFEAEIFDDGPEALLEEAREALMLRTLRSLQTVEHLQDQAQTLEARTERLEELNQRDPLTNLFNRRHLDTFLREAFVDRDKDCMPLSIAFVDLDGFKAINDRCGHQIGDQILVAIAAELQANTRSSDLVARYGGDEFIIVLPRTAQHQAEAICARIVRSIGAKGHVIGNEQVTLTVSIGIATHGDGISFRSIEDFISAADTALYSAKVQGRNRSVIHEQVA